MARKLGATQIDVLKSMLYSPCVHDRKFVSSWWHGCGWTWSTAGGTEKIMESLVNRGLVNKTRKRGNPYARFTYTVNDAAARKALKAQGITVKKWGE